MFDEDDLVLIEGLELPNNSVDSLEKFGSSFLDLYDFDIFLTHPHLTEINKLSGVTDILLEPENPTINLISEAEIINAEIKNGKHHFFFEGSELNLHQADGDSVIFIHNLNASSVNAEISSGSIQIYIDTDQAEGNLQQIGNEIFFGEQKLDIKITASQEISSTVSIYNLRNGEELLLENEVFDVIKPIPDEKPVLIESQPNVKAETLNTEAELELIFSEENGDLLIKNEDSINDNPYYPSIETNNFSHFNYFHEELDMFFSSNKDDNIDINNVENSYPAENNIEIQDLINFSDYSDFEWENAIEIIEDL